MTPDPTTEALEKARNVLSDIALHSGDSHSRTRAKSALSALTPATKE